MANVLSNSMVAHVWAQQTQESGRSGNGQFFFTGRILYSYGSHFVVGYIMPDGTALLNSESYSITTSQHQGHARYAARGRVVFVPNLTDLEHGHGLHWFSQGDKARARPLIRTHVERNALRIPAESAGYLLGLVGLARSWDSIKRKAEIARDKAKARDKAAEIAERKADVEHVAALSDSQFADLTDVRENARVWGHFPSAQEWRGKEWRNATPTEALAEFATELYRLSVTAKAHCSKRVQQIIAARLKATRTRVKRLKTWDSHSQTLAAFMRAKAYVRTYFAARESEPLSRQTNTQFRDLVAYLADVRPGLLTAAGRATLARIVAECDSAERVAAEMESRERMAKEAADRAKWLAGGARSYLRISDAFGGALLRAAEVERDESGLIIGGTLQTSWGADVPLVHALKAFAFVRRVVTTETADSMPNGWYANGHTIRIGHFHVDSISRDGTMRAGCHTIHLAEMERLAGVLDVFAAPQTLPSDAALEPSRGAA